MVYGKKYIFECDFEKAIHVFLLSADATSVKELVNNLIVYFNLV